MNEEKNIYREDERRKEENNEENKKENNEENKEEGKDKKQMKTKKEQNMIAIMIILAGLFVGSIYVDITQLVKKEGVSLKKLENVDVFEAYGKTWVSSNDPIVEMTILNDKDCGEACQTEPLIDAIKKTALPTLIVKEITIDSEEGQKMIKDYALKAVPAYIFNNNIEKTDFYEQAQPVLEKKENGYLLNNAMAGVPFGKYITLPPFESASEIRGEKDAPLGIIIFSDFQCPFSKQFNDIFNKVLEKYKEKVKVAFYQYPLNSIHPQATNASLASLCANDQGKFWEMSQALFDKQSEWGVANAGKEAFTKIASELKLEMTPFNKCMEEETHKEAIKKDENVALEYGLGGTPAVFIGTQNISGVATEDKLIEMIEQELEKNTDQN